MLRYFKWTVEHDLSYVSKRQRISKGQYKMKSPEKLVKQCTQETGKQNKNTTQYVFCLIYICVNIHMKHCPLYCLSCFFLRLLVTHWVSFQRLLKDISNVISTLLSVHGIQHDHLGLNEPCDHEVYIFVNVSIMKRTIPYLRNILKIYTLNSNGQ